MKLFLFKKVLPTLAMVALMSTLSACGGSSDSSGSSGDSGSDLTASQQAEVNASVQAVIGSVQMVSTSFVSSSSSATARYRSAQVEIGGLCDSGHFYIDDEEFSMTFDECVLNTSDSTLTFDGGFSFTTETAGTATVNTIEYEDFSMTSEETNSTANGSIAVISDSDTPEELTISFGEPTDYVVTNDESSLTVEGALTMNVTENTLNGTMAFTVDSEEVTCTFTDFNLATSSCADYAEACGFASGDACS